MDSLNVPVLLLAVVGGVLVTDMGGLRSRAMRKKAEADADRRGLAGTWVDAEAGADALQRRYDLSAIAFGWALVVCALGVFVSRLG
ncbi:MAG: hypothetical protein AB7O74_03465 [Candidatus Nanopelagicales bacterium]